MFPLPISAYFSAKYTYFCSHRGEKTRRTPLIRGDQGLHTFGRRGNPSNPNRGGGGRCCRNCHHNRYSGCCGRGMSFHQ
ncbi:hypothetical protein AB205_0183900 [Aquarana catesbeiana]|uniref:Uncharacterized protein n=1 Tax=Aquarana catesbeiana TaxID=8400 RepID=A0A2G9QCA6_AQUCT|nr:hypothetical protein AB205_0183900 [Aquarana catesbeiana]